MPYLSDAELTALTMPPSSGSSSSNDDTPALDLLPMLGALGISGAMGLLRAKLEDPATGQWLVPGTRWDAEAALFIVASAVTFGGKYVGLGGWQRLASLSAIGIGSRFLGELGHQYGKTGRLSLTVGEGVPPWDPSSYDPTQFAGPHDDPQARGLASSGV